jgi:hypothetical protein
LPWGSPIQWSRSASWTSGMTAPRRNRHDQVCLCD